MNLRWRRLLRREIRLPWWALVALSVASLAVIVASHWREANRRRAAWQAADRPRPNRLEDYQNYQRIGLRAGIDRPLLALTTSYELLLEHHPAHEPQGAVARNNLACIYLLQRRPAAAECLFRESLQAHRKFLGPDDENVRIIQQNLAALKTGANAAQRVNSRRSPSAAPGGISNR